MLSLQGSLQADPFSPEHVPQGATNARGLSEAPSESSTAVVRDAILAFEQEEEEEEEGSDDEDPFARLGRLGDDATDRAVRERERAAQEAEAVRKEKKEKKKRKRAEAEGEGKAKEKKKVKQ